MIKAKIQADQLSALKSGEKVKLETLRYILAQIKNKEIEKKLELIDEEVIAILRKQTKEMRESIEAFQKGGRQDLTNQTQAQLTIVKSYLPAEISDEEVEKLVHNVIEENKEVFQKNPKALFGIAVGKLKSQAEPFRITTALQKLITQG